MFKQILRRYSSPLPAFAVVLALAGAAAEVGAQDTGAPAAKPTAIMHKVQRANERIEMTVNSSRILTLDQKIPQAQVNNPELLDLDVLGPSRIQVSAKAPGVTQVNLWGEDKSIYSIVVIIRGDAKELEMTLRAQFPNASLRVIPVGSGVLISGYVDRPSDVDLIVRVAEEYYPKVINAITVGGVQQVLLRVKVIEVSRTKLRRLGFDFAQISGSNLVVSGISGLITAASSAAIGTAGTETFAFNVVDGSDAFFGVLEALRQDNLAKILAEPTMVTVSGRPAFFNVGGEFPIPVPQSLGTLSIEFKKFGTQVDFVPIVLGKGMIRLEVRPRVSEIDSSRSVTIASTTVPGLRTREVDTAVELQAGQTLAIAGLVQQREEAENRGLPWISEVPYLGMPFRRVVNETNEIELLILVTPELVEAMDAHEVPPCGPGMRTTTPDDCDLFFKGHLEVPNCCPSCAVCPPGGGGPHPEPIPEDGMIIEPARQADIPQARKAFQSRKRPEGVASAKAAAAASRTARMATTQRKPSRSAASRPGAGKASSLQNRYTLRKPKASATAAEPNRQKSDPGFIGPVGYNVLD